MRVEEAKICFMLASFEFKRELCLVYFFSRSLHTHYRTVFCRRLTRKAGCCFCIVLPSSFQRSTVLSNIKGNIYSVEETFKMQIEGQLTHLKIRKICFFPHRNIKNTLGIGMKGFLNIKSQNYNTKTKIYT